MDNNQSVKQQVLAGRIGGKAKNPNKGFGSMDKERLIEISRKAGQKSKRKGKKA